MDDFLLRVVEQRRLDDLARERDAASGHRRICKVCQSPVQNTDPQATCCLDCKGVKLVAHPSLVPVYGEDHPLPPLPDFTRCRICGIRLKAHNRSGYCKEHRPKRVLPVHMEDTMAIDPNHPSPEKQETIPGTETPPGEATTASNGSPAKVQAASGPDGVAGNGVSKRSPGKRGGKGRKRSKSPGKAVSGDQKGNPTNLAELLNNLAPAGPSLRVVENLVKHLTAKAIEFETAAKMLRAQALKITAVQEALSKLQAA